MFFKNIELFTFLLVCLVLVFILIGLTYIVSPKNSENEKLSSYECGFEPFSDARRSFDIHFYVVAILFIIFDVEITFLVPWVLTLSITGFYGFLSMIFFIFLFLIGFVYEFKSGIINWIWFDNKNV